MRFRVAQIVSSTALLLFAATSGARPARAEEGLAGIADPCKLVTQEEVQLVLGTPVDRASEVHVKDPVKFPVRICSFHGKNGKVLNVSTGVKATVDFATEWAGKDTIAAVGDAAYSVPPGVIIFQKGTSTCKFQALNFDFARDGHGRGHVDPALAAKMKTLAMAAVGRM